MSGQEYILERLAFKIRMLHHVITAIK